MYNITAIGNQTGLVGLYVGVNTAMSGVFGAFILVIIFALLLILSRIKGASNLESATVASFITVVIAFAFRMMPIINDLILWATIVICGVLVFLMFLAEN